MILHKNAKKCIQQNCSISLNNTRNIFFSLKKKIHKKMIKEWMCYDDMKNCLNNILPNENISNIYYRYRFVQNIVV